MLTACGVCPPLEAIKWSDANSNLRINEAQLYFNSNVIQIPLYTQSHDYHDHIGTVTYLKTSLP